MSRSGPRRFRDRAAAGRRLAAPLARLRLDAPLVLGLPRGGVPVAFEVARALGARLDVWVARKLEAPHRPELAIGAIAEGGGSYIDRAALRILRVSAQDLKASLQRAHNELEERSIAYRGSAPLPAIEGHEVILVDDGLATGATVRAAIAAVRARHPRRLLVAVPVATADALAGLRRDGNEVVCLSAPKELRAVSVWYDHFPQTTDAEVRGLLRRAPTAAHGRGELVVDGMADEPLS